MNNQKPKTKLEDWKLFGAISVIIMIFVYTMYATILMIKFLIAEFGIISVIVIPVLMFLIMQGF